MTTLTFQNTTLSVINQHNQTWLSISDIGKALGYSNPLKGIGNLYSAHQDEFTPNMTALIDMRTNGGVQKVRIFSLRGCHLLGMLSHTKVAKDFRKWVLDILDKETAQPQQLVLTETITPEEQRQIQNAVKATHERTGLSYGEIWARTKNKFNVAKYEQIPRSQLRDVLIYIASMSPIAVEKPTLSYSLLYPLALLYYYSAEFHDSMVKQKAEEPKMWGLLNRQCRTMDRVRLAISMLADELPDPEHKADILAFLES